MEELATTEEDNILIERPREASAVIAEFGGDDNLEYADFDIRSELYSALRSNDYSWKEQGYAQLSRFMPKLADMIDTHFDLSFDLTYNTFSQSKNVDTSPLRVALWRYVQRLLGQCADDFDYRQVNVFLAPNNDTTVKRFVKKVTCYPDDVQEKDFNGFSALLQNSERVHVVMLAAEAKRQALLVYGMRSLGDNFL